MADTSQTVTTDGYVAPVAPAELHVPKGSELLEKGVVFDAAEFRDLPNRRILFVVPPGSVEENYGRMAAAATELPWLGMAYVAAAAREAGNDVKVLDYEAVRANWESVERDIKAFSPDIVAMALFINNVDRCLRVAQIAKSVNRSTKVVLGGPQATIFPDQTIGHSDVDVIVISEAEISFCGVAAHCDDDEALQEVKGIWFKSETGKVIKTPRQPLIDDLDSIPKPALDLYPMEQYYPAVHVWGNKVANYVTSRGCPYECTFCEAKMTFGRTFRYHSPDRVIADLNALNDRYGFDSFQFYDDIFTTNRNRTLELCDKLKENGRKYRWMCWTRTDRLDPELCQAMKEAGCYLIVFGCESGDQKLLDAIKKSLTVEQNYEGIRLANEAGIRTMSSFMLGLPLSSEESTEKTIEFAVKSKLDYAIFPIFEPYPGTEIWEDSVKTGYFIDQGDHQNHLLQNFDKIWVPKDRSREELESAARRAFKTFYLRPKTAWTWLRNLPNMPIKRVARFVWAGLYYLVFGAFVNRVRTYRGRGSRYV